MPRYPRTHSNVSALVDTMIAGYKAHPEDFPRADVEALENARNQFMQSSAELTDAQSLVAIKSKAKEQAFADLVKAMKCQIKQSTVDTADNPHKLTEIGWGIKAAPQPLSPPAEPLNLSIIAVGQGMVYLRWDKLPAQAAGAINHYIIQSRKTNETDNWTLAATTMNTEIKLTNQPKAETVEYRVIAVNKAGESIPSNTEVCAVF